MNFELQSLVQDIAIAMFKVASVVGHKGLKAEIENQSILLAIDPSATTIFRSENILAVGREIGEIKPINAIVLIRELEALRRILGAAPIAPNIDIHPLFTKIPSETAEHQKTVKIKKTVELNPDNLDKDQPGHISRNPAGNENLPKSSKNKKTNSGRRNSLDKDKVYQYIVGHKIARLKELEAKFGEVSGRTVRRITDALIKEGKIERVGNPGPTSFYRIKSAGLTPSVRPAEREIVSAPLPSNPDSSKKALSKDVEPASALQLSYSGNPPVIAL